MCCVILCKIYELHCNEFLDKNIYFLFCFNWYAKIWIFRSGTTLPLHWIFAKHTKDLIENGDSITVCFLCLQHQLYALHYCVDTNVEHLLQEESAIALQAGFSRMIQRLA